MTNLYESIRHKITDKKYTERKYAKLAIDRCKLSTREKNLLRILVDENYPADFKAKGKPILRQDISVGNTNEYIGQFTNEYVSQCLTELTTELDGIEKRRVILLGMIQRAKLTQLMMSNPDRIAKALEKLDELEKKDTEPPAMETHLVSDRCPVHFHLEPDGRCTCEIKPTKTIQ